MELIGTGPSRLWIAGEDQGSGGNGVNEIDTPVRKKGFKGIPFKKNAIDEEDEDFDQIPDVSLRPLLYSSNHASDRD